MILITLLKEGKPSSTITAWWSFISCYKNSTLNILDIIVGWRYKMYPSECILAKSFILYVIRINFVQSSRTFPTNFSLILSSYQITRLLTFYVNICTWVSYRLKFFRTCKTRCNYENWHLNLLIVRIIHQKTQFWNISFKTWNITPSSDIFALGNYR